MTYAVAIAIWIALIVLVWGAFLVLVHFNGTLDRKEPDPDQEIQQDDFTRSIKKWGKVHAGRIH